MVRVDLIHSSRDIDLKPDNWLQYLAIEFIFLRKNYTYLFIVVQESWLENLGTKSSKVRDGKSWESINEFQVGRSDWVRSRCQAKCTGHPCFWILSTRTSPSTKVPARVEFWFGPPFGVSWSSFLISFLRLCEPLGPVWSSVVWWSLVLCEEACCYLSQSLCFLWTKMAETPNASRTWRPRRRDGRSGVDDMVLGLDLGSSPSGRQRPPG